MKLTHKAIARMAGYRVESTYASFPNRRLPYGFYHYWTEGDEKGTGRYECEQDAWITCCVENELIEEE